jgi:hypothetical protein
MAKNVFRKSLVIGIIMLFILVSGPINFTGCSGKIGGGWSIETVDEFGTVGEFSSIELDSNNYPHISYYDDTNGDLKYAKWTGSTWFIQIVDMAGRVGYSSSMALDSNNNPHISYRDIDNEDLKYAKWNGSSWSIETVDSTGDVGDYTSIALDSNNYPHISYWDETNVKYAKWNGSSWSKELIGRGRDSSIAIDTNNYPHISYWNDDLWYAKWTGSSWSKESVDVTGDVGSFNSIALDSNNYPHISYSDFTNFDLKYAKWDGSSWLIETVDSAGDVGGYTSIALDTNNYPHISYFSYSNQNLKYAKWTGSSWLIETVDSASGVGGFPSIALDSNNNPHISYLDFTYWNLKYAKLVNQPPYKPIVTGPITGDPGIEYNYTFNTSDPDNNVIYLWIDWGDDTSSGWLGPYNSGEAVIVAHTFNEEGIYVITAKAKDRYYSEGAWSDPFEVTIGKAPGAPTINGKTSGKPGTAYDYTFNAVDPEGDQVRYIIDWGDGNTDTSSFNPSGIDFTIRYKWTNAGTYTIKANAEDDHGLIGPEATFTVTMSKNKAMNTPFLNFLEEHSNLLLIFQKIIQRL